MDSGIKVSVLRLFSNHVSTEYSEYATIITGCNNNTTRNIPAYVLCVLMTFNIIFNNSQYIKLTLSRLTDITKSVTVTCIESRRCTAATPSSSMCVSSVASKIYFFSIANIRSQFFLNLFSVCMRARARSCIHIHACIDISVGLIQICYTYTRIRYKGVYMYLYCTYT